MSFVYAANCLPYAYLPITASLRTMNPSLEEAARVSGAGALAVRIIRSVRNVYPPAYDTAAMLSMLLFTVLAVMWVVQRNVIRGGHFAQISGKEQARSRIRLGPWRWPARLLLLSYIVLAVALPVLALGVVSLQAYWLPTEGRLIRCTHCWPSWRRVGWRWAWPPRAVPATSATLPRPEWTS